MTVANACFGGAATNRLEMAKVSRPPRERLNLQLIGVGVMEQIGASLGHMAWRFGFEGAVRMRHKLVLWKVKAHKSPAALARFDIALSFELCQCAHHGVAGQTQSVCQHPIGGQALTAASHRLDDGLPQNPIQAMGQRGTRRTGLGRDATGLLGHLTGDEFKQHVEPEVAPSRQKK